MKARYFTYGERPKAVYYLTDIRGELHPKLEINEFLKEVQEKWLTNPDIIVIDDRENAYSSGQIETFEIEKYLDKLEQLKNYFDDDDI
jgi:hypothetical protein